MKIREVTYDYSKIKNKFGKEYNHFFDEISDLKNMVYFLCKDDEYVSVRCTKNSLEERLNTNTPKLFDADDFKKSNKIIALLLDGDEDTKKLIEIKKSFANYYGLIDGDDK